MTTWYEGEAPQPKLGPKAKQALVVSEPWKRSERKLFVLLAAFADVDVPNPFAKDLAQRLGISIPKLDRQLDSLASRGVLWTVRRKQTRNTYILLTLGDQIPEYDRENYLAWKQARRERREAEKREPVAA